MPYLVMYSSLFLFFCSVFFLERYRHRFLPHVLTNLLILLAVISLAAIVLSTFFLV